MNCTACSNNLLFISVFGCLVYYHGPYTSFTRSIQLCHDSKHVHVFFTMLQAQLEMIMSVNGLSENVYEIASKSLAA